MSYRGVVSKLGTQLVIGVVVIDDPVKATMLDVNNEPCIIRRDARRHFNLRAKFNKNTVSLSIMCT